jgi:hypothetical protein
MTMNGKYKDYINYGGAFLLTWLLGFGFLVAIFDIDPSSYIAKFLLKIASPFFAFVSIIFYYIGKTKSK